MDTFDLDRFVEAQNPIYVRALTEVRRGQKRSHWMWFIFPQLTGLGMSSTANHFGIAGIEEARAYLAHPILGTRLVECTAAVNLVEGGSAEQIFGFPDCLKFRSCMTLFAEASGSTHPCFTEALAKYFAGQLDQRTLELLQA